MMTCASLAGKFTVTTKCWQVLDVLSSPVLIITKQRVQLIFHHSVFMDIKGGFKLQRRLQNGVWCPLV